MERQIPSNLAAERAVLGSILGDRDAILAIAPSLHVEDFYLDRHRWVYQCARSCYERRVPPDLQTVAEELRARGWLETVGDLPGLVELSESVPTSLHVEFYAQIVSHLARCRRLIRAGNEISALGYESERDGRELAGDAQAVLNNAVAVAAEAEVYSMGQVADLLYAGLEKPGAAGIPTGLQRLDWKLGGLHHGELTMLAARPSVGKSSLALQIAYNVARDGRRVYFASLEMSVLELSHRLAALRSGVDGMRFRQGTFSDAELARVTDALGRITHLPMVIDPTPNSSVSELRQRILRYAFLQGNPDLVVVDYLGLMRGEVKRRDPNRVQEIGEISRGLKQLARELDCALLVLGQLNRAIEERQHKVPQLSDLRDGGTQEQDSDVVLFLAVPEQGPPGIVEVHIAKQRQGPLGVVPLYFEPAVGRWSDLETRREQ